MQQIKPFYSHIAIAVGCLLVGSVATHFLGQVKVQPATVMQQAIQPATAATESKPKFEPKQEVTKSMLSYTQRLEMQTTLAVCWQGYPLATDVRRLSDKELNDKLYECKLTRPGL